MTNHWPWLASMVLLAAPALGQVTGASPHAPIAPVLVLYPPVPTVIPDEVSPDYFAVQWSYPGTGQGGFEITASSDGWLTVAYAEFVGPDRESTVISNLTSSTTYDWRVRTLPPGPPVPSGCSPATPCGPGPQVVMQGGVPPNRPTNLQAPTSGIGATAVQLTWTDNSNPPLLQELSFRVARLDPGEDAGEFIDWDNVSGDLPPDTTSFVAGNLLPSTTYRFKVRARTAYGFSHFSDTIAVTTTGAPARPTNLAVSQYDANNITLTWQDNALDETAYRVSILPPNGDPNNDAEWNGISGDLPANTTTYTATGLLQSRTYQFRVRARNDTIPPPTGPLYSTYSNVVIQRTSPATPTNLTATAVGVDYVTVSWVDNASHETAYRVSYLPPGGVWTNSGGDLSPQTVEHTVPGLLSGEPYSFRVRAEDSTVSPSVYSPYSNVVTLTTPVPLAAPSNMAIAAVGPDWIQMTWNENNPVGATSYRVAVIRPEDPGNWQSLSGDIAPGVGTYTATQLLPNATYQFKVRCSNADVTPVLYSNYSNVATGATVCPLPAAPTGLNTSAVSDTCVVLVWNDVANNELAYRVAMLPPGLADIDANWVGISGDLPAGTTTFTKTGLTTGATYRFKVRGSNACGYGDYSNVLTVAVSEQGPLAPTACVAARQGNTAAADPVLVTWNHGGAAIDGFRIARLGPGGDPLNDPDSAWVNVGGDINPALRQYLNTTGLTDGLRYYYKVRAYRETPCGRVYSAYSNYDSAIP